MTSRTWIRHLFARTPRTGRKSPACVRPRLEPLEDRTCPSVFYDFNVIARTGDSVGGQTLTALGNAPAVSNGAAVAFVGTSSAAQGLYVGGGTGTPVKISDASSDSRAFGPELSINSAQMVTAADSSVGPPQEQQVARWDGPSSPGQFTLVADQATPGLDSLGTAVAMNSVGDVVYTDTLAGVNSLDYYRADRGTSSFIARFETAQALFPSVSDTRSVVVRTSNARGQTAIDLYSPRGDDDSYTTTVIASAANGFTTLGARPGISADGSIVVFAGSRGADQGVWASIAGNNGTRSLVRLTGGFIGGRNNPELGYNGAGGAIFLRSFDLDQPVRVARQALQHVGESLDSFVVTFQATPSSASIANPTPGVTRPLLFTAQDGIWSERVDAERQTEAPRNLVWHRTSPIPVVQIGDLVGGKTVASFGGAAIANASTDVTAAGNPARIQRRGDHQVVFWASTSDGTQMVVRGRHLDSDQDGLLDHWESATGGIDIDQDGTVDLKLSDWGAQVNKRDLFLEMDWTTPRMENGQVVWKDEPVAGATAALANMFAGAPAVGTGPSAIPAGITLHIDAGGGLDSAGNPFSQNVGTAGAFGLSGGQLIGMQGDPNGHPDIVYMGRPGSATVFGGKNFGSLNARSFDEIKRPYLGLPAEKDARELAFHYLVLADFNGVQRDAEHRPLPPVAVASAGRQTLTAAVDLPPELRRGTPIIITSGAGAGQVRFVTAVNVVNTDQGPVRGREMTLDRAWSTEPNDTSRFALLNRSLGLGEVDWRGSPDNGPFPGNDLLLTLGDFRSNGFLGTLAQQWQVMAHELGHNLGLRDHGYNHLPNNDTNYRSLMSDAYRAMEGGTVKSYAGAGDLVFNDWANLRLDFQSAFHHLGNTFNIGALRESKGPTTSHSPTTSIPRQWLLW